MDRRQFLQTGLAAGAATTLVTSTLRAQDAPAQESNAAKFKLKYAPHFGMFRNLAGDDPIDQLKFAADQGFTAWEDNGMKNKPVELQEKIAKTMSDLGMTMGVFVATAGGGFNTVSFAGTDKNAREKTLQEVRDSIDVAKRCNVKWMTIVLGGFNTKLEMGYQMAHTIDLLRQASDICEPHGLVMVMEPLNWWTNHPGVFLTKVPQAYEICRGVDSPACKILFDIYHQQITEGNLIPNIDMAYSEIGYFQSGDNPGRKEPGTGEINYQRVFGHIHKKGFDGVIGMEHGNSIGGAEGEWAVIKAYRQADNFAT